MINIKKTALLFLCSLCFISHAQISLQNTKKFIGQYKNIPNEDYTLSRDSLGNVDYLVPYLNYFSNFVKDKRAIDNGNGQISQMLATLGCYKEAIELIRDPSATTNSQTLAQIQGFVKDYSAYFDISKAPASYISEKAGKAPITMINEAHDYPAHRAFIMSLLPKLKEQGYKYLAMETLSNPDENNPTHSKYLKSLNQNIGFYTSEPVFGELVRYALELGYILVPYEHVPHAQPLNMNDTAQFIASIHERDSMQAINLIQAMKECKDGKMLVIGGYAHTFEAEENMNGVFNPFHPMALYFKELTHTDPLTINQVQLSETNRRMGGFVFDELSSKGFVNTPACIKGEDTTLIGSVVQKGLSDIYTLLPKTTYVNGRPTWLILNGLRKKYRYTLPKEVMDNLVLVQAYYLSEVQNEKAINQKVPADQFMLLENNNLDFYLRPGFSYLIVCRDINNNIIYKKKFQAQ